MDNLVDIVLKNWWISLIVLFIIVDKIVMITPWKADDIFWTILKKIVFKVLPQLKRFYTLFKKGN